jgi:membrane-bound lytic murein transglycosylase A
MRRTLGILSLTAALMAAVPSLSEVLDFEALDGWRDDNHLAALDSFLRTCDLIDAPDWQPVCAVAADVPRDDASARSFFELFFKPVVIGQTPSAFHRLFRTRTRRLPHSHRPLPLSDLRPPPRTARGRGLPFASGDRERRHCRARAGTRLA